MKKTFETDDGDLVVRDVTGVASDVSYDVIRKSDFIPRITERNLCEYINNELSKWQSIVDDKTRTLYQKMGAQSRIDCLEDLKEFLNYK